MKQRITKLIAVYAAVLILLGIFAVIFFATGTGIPCIFNMLTGLKCPGCGITRAVKAAAELRFTEALSYNIMFPFELAYILYAAGHASVSYLKNGKSDLMLKPVWLNIAFLSVIVVWWVLRNILGI